MSLHVIDRIAEYADIDTRRAMGYPPRKLNFDPEFNPRGFESELFVYYPEERKLVYWEVGRYGYLYYEIVTEVVNLQQEMETPCQWRSLPGSRTRGVICSDDRINEYDTVSSGEFYTVGCPSLAISSTSSSL
jgi:hypothetical protein